MYNLSYLLNVCETTLNENNTENTARLVVGLENLENKVQFDKSLVNKSDQMIKEEFLKALLQRKKELDSKIKETTKKIKNKNLSLASKALSIEQKLQAIAKKTNSFEIRSREMNYVDNSIENMNEYLNTAEKDLEDVKFMAGGQTDSYYKKDADKMGSFDTRIQKSMTEVDKPAILGFAERIKNSLKILEDNIFEAETDIKEMKQTLGYRII